MTKYICTEVVNKERRSYIITVWQYQNHKAQRSILEKEKTTELSGKLSGTMINYVTEKYHSENESGKGSWILYQYFLGTELDFSQINILKTQVLNVTTVGDCNGNEQNHTCLGLIPEDWHPNEKRKFHVSPVPWVQAEGYFVMAAFANW